VRYTRYLSLNIGLRQHHSVKFGSHWQSGKSVEVLLSLQRPFEIFILPGTVVLFPWSYSLKYMRWSSYESYQMLIWLTIQCDLFLAFEASTEILSDIQSKARVLVLFTYYWRLWATIEGDMELSAVDCFSNVVIQWIKSQLRVISNPTVYVCDVCVFHATVPVTVPVTVPWFKTGLLFDVSQT